LAPTVGIAVTGFCHPGGILQIFLSKRSAISSAAHNRSSQIDSTEFIINISYQDLHRSPSRIIEFVQISGSLDEFPTSRKSNPIQAETRRKVFIEAAYTSSFDSIALTHSCGTRGSTSTSPRAHGRETTSLVKISSELWHLFSGHV
jgi:hypothetical protein